jgi:hypothetical protein
VTCHELLWLCHELFCVVVNVLFSPDMPTLYNDFV